MARDKATTLFFTAPKTVELRREELPPLNDRQVKVVAEYSAISSGTEGLIYRGEAPEDMPADSALPALSGALSYPLSYGYAMVGRVVALGRQVDDMWLGKRVFTFHPHASHAVIDLEDVIPVPADCSPADASLLPTMETAVNFVMDGHPMIGERVLVFGQGVVGLLTTALLSRYPLGRLVTVDRSARRRALSRLFGAETSVDPDDGTGQIREVLNEGEITGADVTYELSGNPEALNSALSLTGFGGRIVIGSWYGRKRAALDLGGRFHRSRIRLISSQVSTIDPPLRGRWSKQRRLDTAWRLLATIQPASSVVTHRIPIEHAAKAYRLLDEQPDQAVQVLFTYD